MQQLLKTVQSSCDTLPPAQRAVAVYILEHYQEIPFQSVTVMAREVGVSDTTIIKYCMQLGFSGFGDFKRKVSDYVQSQANWSKKLERSLDELEAHDSYSMVYHRELNNLQTTMTNPVNRQSYEKLLDMLERAENVYVMGFRASSFPAQYMAMVLGQLGYRSFVIAPGAGDYYETVFRMTSRDLLISFCNSRYGQEGVRIARRASEAGIPHAAFTDSPTSPTAVCSDCTFLCSVQAYGTTPSLTSAFSMINMVVTGCAQRRPAEVKDHLSKLEQFISDCGVYHAARVQEGKESGNRFQ